MFFDSHCHLTDTRLFAELPIVLERAASAEVSRILSISVDLDDTEKVLKIADAKRVFASAGVHPASALTWHEESAARLMTLAHNARVIAIGECGLDYIYDETHAEYPGATRARQAQVFEAQLVAAARLKLPVVIHNREADADVLAILRNHRKKLVGGVFHCFGSDRKIAEQVLELDFHLGFTGIVTFKNALELQEVAKMCPPNRILIETDAPYLAPMPHRGQMNEPSFVPFVAQKIGDLKGVSREEIGEITTQNARALFAI
ncbi:TatD DNase family protein [Abditibacterium utsteinense]|uniref:TatD DNase family protein n=1 Tax=Abditibacterium utsteinense TaxID=1960156 RepID=A0A2S8SU65_9BACT|nr:TatD family hydrolase [Abditibacterium utsteinense]PQV64336.1 TatD DNase family protein [Abditibacterium utsteinense]